MTCNDCHREAKNAGFGLCNTCRARRARRDLPYSGYNVPGRDRCEDYEIIRDAGTGNLRLAAQRLGCSHETLYQALYRRGYRYNEARDAYYRD